MEMLSRFQILKIKRKKILYEAQKSTKFLNLFLIDNLCVTNESSHSDSFDKNTERVRGESQREKESSTEC